MGSPIAFDLETHKFRRGSQAPIIVCLSWATENDFGLIVSRKEIEEWAHKYVNKTLLIGHNVAFDCSCLLSNFPSLKEAIWNAYKNDLIACTQTREQLLNIATGEFRQNRYDLASISRKRLRYKINKKDSPRLFYSALDGVPIEEWPKESIDYAIKDSLICYAVYQHQEQRAAKINYTMPTQFDDTRAAFALKLMSAWGIQTDVARAQELSKRTITEMYSLLQDLIYAGIIKHKVRKEDIDYSQPPTVHKSTNVVRDLVKKYYPGPPPTTDKGNIKTGEEVLSKCDYPPFKKLIRFDYLRKLHTTYIEKLLTGLVHAWFKAIGADSVRTSCANPNLQNQPRLPGIRECFIPRPGYVFLSADYDSQEMRTLAQSCLDLLGMSTLANKYRKDVNYDPHLEFAARLANVSVSEAKKLKKQEDPYILDLRQQAKVANFGYPGGMGSDTFVTYAAGYNLIITPERSAYLKDQWFLQLPEMKEYFSLVNRIVHGPKMQTMTRSGLVRAAPLYCPACNSFFQTPAAHCTKKAVFDACYAAYMDKQSPLYGSRPVAFIHDELIFEVPEAVGHWAAIELKRIMVKAQEHYTPDVPASADAVLMRRWSKKAKKVYNEQGHLMPWDEE